MARIKAPTFPGHDFSILDYGAKPDGQTDASPAIRAAIDACGEMDSPELDCALRIKSNARRGGVVENIHMRNVQVGPTGRRGGDHRLRV